MDNNIIKTLVERVMEASKETKTLYELSEAELIVLTGILQELPINEMSASLLGRLLRAAAHFIERNHEIAVEIAALARKDDK